MFALATAEEMIVWADGKLDCYPERSLDRAENALAQLARDGSAGATPTGPFYQADSAEAALLTLRALWPQAQLLGEPPLIPGQPDELGL